MTKKNIQQPNPSNSIFSSKWAILVSTLLLIFSTFIYYSPSLNDKSLPAHDFQQGITMSSQLSDYHDNTGKYANWAPNMFSGMPAFQIWKSYPNVSSWIVDGLYNLTNPYIFIGIFIAISSAILFYVMGAHPIIVFIGGISLILSNFTVISLFAGHNNKVMVMSIVPLTIAGIWLLYEKKKYLIALFIISLSISLQVRLNHVQITYFMLFLISFWTLFKMFEAIQQKDFKHIILSATIITLGIGIGAFNNASQLLTTKEYSEETQRGGPSPVELARNADQIKSDGVDYDYATSWSYGILETFTLLIPNFSGGPEVLKDIDENNEIAKALIQNGVPASNAIQVAGQLPTYWGPQPFVAGTTYISAVLIFLMILGFFLLKDHRKWWLLSSFIFTLFIAWGNNFSILYKFLFNYLPYFNKFRTPSMVFYLTTIIVSVTAALTLNALVKQAQDREIFWDKFFKVSAGFLGFMLFMTILGPYVFSFSSEVSDANLKSQLLQMTQNNSNMADAIFGGLIQERKSMMRADAFRSTLLIALVVLLIAAFIKRKLSPEIMLTGIAVLLLIDIVGVDNRYVKFDSYKDNSASGINGPLATNADRLILQDTSDYRVLNLTVNSFSDANPSFYHKNIGGYHSVKLKRYQDIITYQINDNIQQLSSGNINGARVLNMLNAKYIITSPENTGVFKNDFAYGNAWLVNNVKVYNGPVEVFDNLMKEDLLNTVLLEKPNSKITQSITLPIDSTAKIDLIKSSNDEMIYTYQSKEASYAVFSEIYYNNGKGWSAYIDGKKVDHDQVNYVLRGLSLPAGLHEVSFKFDTPTLQMTKKIDFATSVIIILIGLMTAIMSFMEYKKNKNLNA